MTLKTFTDPIYATVRYVNNVLLAFQVVLICYVVFARFILNDAPSWGEELSLMIMVWYCLMSPSQALRDNSHLSITLLEAFVPGAAIRIIDAFNHILILGFGVFMLVEGRFLAELTVRNIMPGLGISSSWLYASVAVSGVLLIIAALERIIEILSVPGDRYIEKASEI